MARKRAEPSRSLNLPKKDGREVLEEIKSDDLKRFLQVVKTIEQFWLEIVKLCRV